MRGCSLCSQTAGVGGMMDPTVPAGVGGML